MRISYSTTLCSHDGILLPGDLTMFTPQSRTKLIEIFATTLLPEQAKLCRSIMTMILPVLCFFLELDLVE
jgi:hypothetical protein